MSYCVNCGVELDKSLRKCPLCNTPVLNPREIMSSHDKPFGAPSPFPEEKGQVEMVKRKDVAILLTTVVVATAIYTNQAVYTSFLLDGLALGIYLYLLTYMTTGSDWFWRLGLPIVVLVTALIELFVLCLRKLPRSFLTTALYAFTALAVLCIGLEILIDRFLREEIKLGWSAIVLTVCTIVDITIITLLSRKQLRNAVRRRLHF